ncbi:potassium-transporting ATPase subunit C [Streptomyces sp. NPDC039016]|uniref:potassium-transporting ATPase subunit C n=1 Tax=unclassified Streptomyces TaxID=2593676 RepID=UPI0033F44A5E
MRTHGLPPALRQHLTALRILLVFTVLTGLAYPLLVTAIAQTAFPQKANGSLITPDGGPSPGPRRRRRHRGSPR